MGDVAAASTWPLAGRGLCPSVLLGPPLGVRRCLFGPVDHEKTKTVQDAYFERKSVADKERWNFDFEREQPLPAGRYEWEAKDGSADETRIASQDHVQKRITDFMRKRKSSTNHKTKPDDVTPKSKMSRRSST